VGGVARGRAELAGEAGGVGGQIAEGDGPFKLGDAGTGRGILGEGVVEGEGLVLGEAGEQVCGEDLGEGAEAHDGVVRGRGEGAGGGFAIAAKEGLAAADDDHDHAGGACLGEHLRAEGFGGGEAGKGGGEDGGRDGLNLNGRSLREAGCGDEGEKKGDWAHRGDGKGPERDLPGDRAQQDFRMTWRGGVAVPKEEGAPASEPGLGAEGILWSLLRVGRATLG